ncbi:MAG: 4'-phosphopantetheinyl transferase superfamily protein, partial [Kovacikia sp.]
TPDSSLRMLGVTSSIDILKIQSALERKFNQKLPPLGDAWTIDRIAAQVGQGRNGSTAIVTPAASQPASASVPTDGERSQPSSFSGLFIGVDIEEIDHLPVTSNYRTHDFYQSQFSNEEISYALLKSEPRMHLCGIFCAKEAFKKSAVELIQLRMDEIQIQHRQGRPLISTIHDFINARFNFQVSISHSDHYAVATVLAIAR